ncbi:lipoprotein-anchoring transpeptidase ErfK/SrfK [Rhodoligotrophos appendicifer]|uniref:L,D-transpeptidase family protein n=1 Tax=Rhodoligotrophos appendicifer TaxID=987056 RepID=UPI001FE76BBE|nr:L,D-transpeptidase [Rhodoligotrophos appendicifer]
MVKLVKYFVVPLSFYASLMTFATAQTVPASQDPSLTTGSIPQDAEIVDPQRPDQDLAAGVNLKAQTVPAEDLIPLTNAAVFQSRPFKAEKQDPIVLKLQVMLDRAHASPGVIDGFWGDNVRKAVTAAQEMHGLPITGRIDQQLWDVLAGLDTTPPLRTYVVTEKDVAGPFVAKTPRDYAELSKMETIAYRTIEEMIGEKFHMDEKLVRQLNPKSGFNAGDEIIIADTGKPFKANVVHLIADKQRKQLLGYGSDARLLVAYPATIGSSDMPSPAGTHAVKAIATKAEYWYRPKVNFQQGKNTEVLRLAPGPNNPIGSTWIGLDKPTFGIHGTPEPSKIDKTNSHGCVRLTNWDVEELVHLVKPGVPVEFYDSNNVVGSAQ